ncbi:MAG: hypothetical protein DWH91_12695 [Planctomycetota bacterium]|nr:MAG: hypothetical protein DWH91_12695 [Planctomycetota bacterium]
MDTLSTSTPRSGWPLAAVILGLALSTLSGCRSVFSSDHQPLTLYSEQTEIELGAKAYAEVLQTEPKSQNAHLAEMVKRVGRRISAVSERDYFQWEFTLLAAPTQNAFCLPGGKVAIYEGILPICENEAGLAVVMSHEIAHAIQRHGGERMSSETVVEGGGWILDRFFQNRESERVALIKTAYGLGSKYGVMLPFSRSQESEADSIGLNLMARAGYDPSEAPRFWSRFGQNSGSKLPELLSTHPSDQHRSAELANLVPRAMAVYQGVPQRHGLGEQIPMPPIAGATQTAFLPASAAPSMGVVTTKTEMAPAVTAAVAVLASPPVEAVSTASPTIAAPAATLPSSSPVEAVPGAASLAPVGPDSLLTDAPEWKAAPSSPAISALTIAPAPVVYTGPLRTGGQTAPASVPLWELDRPVIDEPAIQPASAEEPLATPAAIVFPEAVPLIDSPREMPASEEIPADDWTAHEEPSPVAP